ncbi:MAG: hypothetical protein ACXWP5_00910 [Bdellovibrionota bacterium]
MQSRSLSSVLSFGVLALGFSFLAPWVAWAEKGKENYADRPDIQKVRPRSHPELGKPWQLLERGHLEATALFLEMYPEHEIYFLARDSELLYDLIRKVTGKEPAIQSRFHLLNVSRANMNADHVLDYLAQEGISKRSLAAGKKILFVDTGFNGSISAKIRSYFPDKFKSQLRTHLLTSSNPEHPSTRVFLAAINPEAPKLNPGEMHSSIANYEHLPRFTSRSTGFSRVDGRWAAMSPIGNEDDGSVSRPIARAYMEDLADYASRPTSIRLLEERRLFWRGLRLKALSDRKSTVQTLKEYLAANRLTDGSFEPYAEAAVRDFIDMDSKGLGFNRGIRAPDIGLKTIVSTRGDSNKFALMKKYPQWAKVLEDPVTGIKKLLAKGDFQTLGAITDAIVDVEFYQILAAQLGKKEPSPPIRAFFKALIAGKKQDLLTYIPDALIEHPDEMKDLLAGLISQSSDEQVAVIVSTLSNSSKLPKLKDLLELCFEKGLSETRQMFAGSYFSKPISVGSEALLGKLIAKADPKTIAYLASNAFSQPHARAWEKVLRAVIQKGNQETQMYLATRVFSEPHSAAWADELRSLVEKAGPKAITELQVHTFVQPWTKTPEYRPLLEALKIKTKKSRAAYLAKNYVSWKEMKFERLDTVALGDLADGRAIRTPAGQELLIVRRVDAGKRGVVFQVKDHDGHFYALKVARDDAAETLRSIQGEASKIEKYEKLGLPHSQLVESGERFNIKSWVEGVRGDEWLRQWGKSKKMLSSPEWKGLTSLMSDSASKGAYVGDLNPKNLIWDGKQWVIVDSGGIRFKMNEADALNRYRMKMSARWGRVTGCQILLEDALQDLELDVAE